MPDDCELRVNEDPLGIDLFRISENKVYTGPLTIHKNHTWETRWTDGGEDTHHHACSYAGCTAKTDILPHYYAHDSTACRDCGHPRNGEPDSDGPDHPDNPDNPDHPGGSSGGSGGGSSHSSRSESTSYPITVEESSHGEVESNRTRASKGSTVTLTVTPDSGYELDGLTVTDSQGDDVKLTGKGGGKYTFTMPARPVTVRAEFRRTASGYEGCPQDSTCPIAPFADADAAEWYHDGVHYCLENGFMGGFGDGAFGPGQLITRAQLVQLLPKREGRPSADYPIQFEDVPDSAWYAEAVRWAASEGIVSGYNSYRFGPDDNITREQLAVMLWRFAGSPEAAGGLAFTDAAAVSDYAREAMRWAAENGIISGKSGGVLDPQGGATRAEAAAMLMRVLVQ
ncbi:hypothetical protein D7X33_16495 [Butyricicoccus sp. 1XD8-22]|nr:hypothetical protein D7X33_16495 [Butyricicoccus sp. 1XD8-22]